MKNRYLLLRFISFYMYYDGLFNKYIYSGDIDELLGKAMECINSLDDNSVYDIENICKRSLRQINYYIDTDAFRLTDVGDDGKLKRFPVNINIFETLMLLMIHVPYCDYDVKDKLAGRICELKSSEEFRQLLNNNRDGAVKTKKRYEMIMKIAGEISD